MEKPATYTKYDIDVNLAESVWTVLDALEIAKSKPKEIGIRISTDSSGCHHVEYTVPTPEDDLTAILNLEPICDKDAGFTDQDLERAVKFMYLYQAVHSAVQKYISDLE